jgi:hypothetical protein
MGLSLFSDDAIHVSGFGGHDAGFMELVAVPQVGDCLVRMF